MLLILLLANPWLTGAAAEIAMAAPASGATDAQHLSTESGFRRATGSRQWQFPRDHGQHPDYLLEWWYYTGNLRTASGRRFGYQLTFFRKGLAPRHKRSSAWAVRSLYMAHAALSDVEARAHLSVGRLARDGPAAGGSSMTEHRVWLAPWRAEPLPGDPHGVRLSVRSARFALELELRSLKPPVLHGTNGLDRKGSMPGQASWYYSLPRLATTGFVEIEGRRHAVLGTSWMDHEFGTNQLGDDQAGWDWFALRLEDGRDLMLYRLRLNDGGTDPLSGGSLIDANGRREALRLGGQGAGAARLAPLRFWRSPASGSKYPVAWRIELPGQGLRLEVTPEFDAQELTVGRGVLFPYWEGAVRVKGISQGKTIAGEGYMELTGYGGKLRDAFK
ncbi:MAG: carotenoid 1,2-hydratase [SAR324 cluster bacterium]|nr:carotenoid 1,2-hydratase [SAR324 cluster bacterium]